MLAFATGMEFSAPVIILFLFHSIAEGSIAEKMLSKSDMQLFHSVVASQEPTFSFKEASRKVSTSRPAESVNKLRLYPSVPTSLQLDAQNSRDPGEICIRDCLISAVPNPRQ